MSLFPGVNLSGLRSAIQHRMQQKQSKLSRSTDILTTVERVVDGTDSKIRLINSYRKKLQEAVGNAMEYTDELIDQIPAAIEISSSTFASNPYVNAFFVNVSDLQTIFSHSSEVREFMEDLDHLDSPQCCALLCMKKTEKTVMGVELVGDTLKRDVRQTAVSFSDHRVYSPASSEAETRKGLKQCLFGGLVTNALEHIVQLRLASHQLKREKQMLLARLRHCERSDATAELAEEIADIREQLRRVEQELEMTRPVTPRESLQQVKTVFGRPDEFVRFTKCSLRLDKMGIKISGDSSKPSNRLELAEVELAEDTRRIVVLTRLRQDELQLCKAFPYRPMMH